MNYADIKRVDVANGEGVRVSVFVSGCNHHCKGCFNQCAWDFNYGNKFTDEQIDTVLKYKYYIVLPVILISIFLFIVLHYSKRKQVNQKKTKKANGLIPIAEKNTFCTENEEELKEII